MLSLQTGEVLRAWHYANLNWRSAAEFQPVDGGYRFVATTYYTRKFAENLKDGQPDWDIVDDPILTWISEPFQLSEGQREIVLQCTVTVSKQIGRIVGHGSPEPGEYKRAIRLKPVVNLEGVWEDKEDVSLFGGIYLTRDTHQ